MTSPRITWYFGYKALIPLLWKHFRRSQFTTEDAVKVLRIEFNAASSPLIAHRFTTKLISNDLGRARRAGYLRKKVVPRHIVRGGQTMRGGQRHSYALSSKALRLVLRPSADVGRRISQAKMTAMHMTLLAQPGVREILRARRAAREIPLMLAGFNRLMAELQELARIKDVKIPNPGADNDKSSEVAFGGGSTATC